MDKLAAQQIKQDYYKLGNELALQQSGLLKTASKSKKLLAALAALGAGAGATLGATTLGGELGSRLFSNESFLEQLPNILSKTELDRAASNKVVNALSGARTLAPVSTIAGLNYLGIPTGEKVYKALATPKKGLIR